MRKGQIRERGQKQQRSDMKDGEKDREVDVRKGQNLERGGCKRGPEREKADVKKEQMRDSGRWERVDVKEGQM